VLVAVRRDRFRARQSDALRIVARGVNTLIHKDNACVLVTHYSGRSTTSGPDYVT